MLLQSAPHVLFVLHIWAAAGWFFSLSFPSSHLCVLSTALHLEVYWPYFLREGLVQIVLPKKSVTHFGRPTGPTVKLCGLELTKGSEECTGLHTLAPTPWTCYTRWGGTGFDQCVCVYVCVSTLSAGINVFGLGPSSNHQSKMICWQGLFEMPLCKAFAPSFPTEWEAELRSSFNTFQHLLHSKSQDMIVIVSQRRLTSI